MTSINDLTSALKDLENRILYEINLLIPIQDETLVSIEQADSQEEINTLVEVYNIDAAAKITLIDSLYKEYQEKSRELAQLVASDEKENQVDLTNLLGSKKGGALVVRSL